VIRKVADVVNAQAEGRSWLGYLRRGGPALAANVWADLSYAAGTPAANYYASAPLEAAALPSRVGIDVGPLPAAGQSKHVSRLLVLPPTACGIMQFELVDMLLYYPFVDGDGGAQTFDNRTATMPRTGVPGCRIAVVSQGIGSGDVSAIVTYRNQLGAQKSVTCTLRLSAAAGQLCSSFPPGSAIALPSGPYLPLAIGDTCVQSIESVEYLSSGGGVQAFVIVRPLLGCSMFEATVAPVEVDCLADRTMMLPRVADGAVLQLFARGTVAASPATITAQLETVWG
jgi:hypothetical protein